MPSVALSSTFRRTTPSGMAGNISERGGKSELSPMATVQLVVPSTSAATNQRTQHFLPEHARLPTPPSAFSPCALRAAVLFSAMSLRRGGGGPRTSAARSHLGTVLDKASLHASRGP